MLWFKKDVQPTSINEYTEIVKRLVLVEQEVIALKIENKTLRDKVLRKIQKLPEYEEDTPLAKNIKPSNPFQPIWR